MKLCVFCIQFYFDMGEEGYSDETPGYGASVGCHKQRWEMSNNGELGEFREHIVKAHECKFYYREKKKNESS